MKIEVSGRESKLQALVYDILPPTTAIVGYVIGLRKLSASLPDKDPPFPWKQAEKNFALFQIWLACQPHRGPILPIAKLSPRSHEMMLMICRASCPRMSVDILGTNCDQCLSMVQCCFTSTETVRLIMTESTGRSPRLLSHEWGV